MKRQIITIDEDLCDGCGVCIPGCHEGALQIIDGKARLISDLFCDGLGACIGSCPKGAISIEEREAEPYDELLVIQSMLPKGNATIKAHLKHLKDHGEMGFHAQALAFLKDQGYDINELTREDCTDCNCSGHPDKAIDTQSHPQKHADTGSKLRHWPVQLQLINPAASFFDNADLLISADCVPYAFGDFHNRFLENKVVITFCPKLDKENERYIAKLAQIFGAHNINSVTIVRMEVPCCGGVELIVQRALEQAGKMHFVKVNVISVDGKIV